MFTLYKRVVLLLCLAALTYGCNDGRNGTYLIYDVTPLDVSVTWMPNGYSDSISNEVKNSYSGRQLTLDYTDKYVKLNIEGQQLILTKIMDQKLGEVYHEQHSSGPVTINSTLRKHKENLVLIVCKTVKQPKPPGYPKSPFDFSWKPELNGIVICYLSKDKP